MGSESGHPAHDLLVTRGISKRFGITQALDGVSVGFRAGEVHALMGENGAGKSTLGKVIAGLHRQDAGSVHVAGRELAPGSIHDALAAGVRIVHQELAQCPNLSVAENLCLHDLPARAGVVDRRAMARRAAALLHRLDPSIDVEAPLGSLSPGRRQIVQIASSLDDEAGPAGADRARIIVFDEPTSSLSIAEADRLLEIVRQLARSGITIVYVSHRMGEIFQVCDRVSVLRDGKFVRTNDVRDIDEPALVEQMIGRRLEPTARRRTPPAPHAEPDTARALAGAKHAHAKGRLALQVRGLSSPRGLREIDLDVHAGEIVGVGGLVGAGRSELLDAVFGLDPRARGRVVAMDRDLSGKGPRAAIAAGVGYVPEDRRLQGLFFQLGIAENIVLPFMRRLARGPGVRSMSRERELVDSKVADYQVKAASTADSPSTLSGGNQQKLLIARWMGGTTRVLLLDEPTRGIDVGTKAEVYKLVHRAADDGVAVLLVSSEMPELLALSDRVLVMASGRVTGQLSGADMTQANVLRLATVEHARAATG